MYLSKVTGTGLESRPNFQPCVVRKWGPLTCIIKLIKFRMVSTNVVDFNIQKFLRKRCALQGWQNSPRLKSTGIAIARQYGLWCEAIAKATNNGGRTWKSRERKHRSVRKCQWGIFGLSSESREKRLQGEKKRTEPVLNGWNLRTKWVC